MGAVLDRSRADATITMRISTQTRDLIDQAAALLDKSRSEFMIESARATALDVTLDQRVFHLDAAQSEALAEALANPPRPSAALKRLMATRAPWE